MNSHRHRDGTKVELAARMQEHTSRQWRWWVALAGGIVIANGLRVEDVAHIQRRAIGERIAGARHAPPRGVEVPMKVPGADWTEPPRVAKTKRSSLPRRVPKAPKPLLEEGLPDPTGTADPLDDAFDAGPLFTLDRVSDPALLRPPMRTYDDRQPTRIVDDAIARGERELALDFPGATVIASALATAVRAHSPPESAASFLAHVGSDGHVLSIRLVSSTNGLPSDWGAASAAAERGLRGQRLTLRHRYRSGAHVAVALESDLQTPGRWLYKTPRKGTSPPSRPVVETFLRWFFHAPPPDEAGTRDAVDPPINHRPVPLELPPDMSGFGRLGSRTDRTPTSGFGFAFDVSDIGTHPQRIVYVRSVTVTAIEGAKGLLRDQPQSSGSAK